MPIFRHRTVLVPETSFRLGELDYSIPGCYDNIHTYPMEAKPGKDVYVSVKATVPVDISIVDAAGMNAKFKAGITDETVGPVQCGMKGIMTLILGINAGDRSDVTVSAWME